MAYKEAEFKADLVQALEFYDWNVQAHEDKHVNFIPDLSFGARGRDGWIEVKYQDEVPGTLGSIRHYTVGQQDWLERRAATGGGHCYLILGTRNLTYVWQANVLGVIRDMPFDQAVIYGGSFIGLGKLAQTLHRRLAEGR